MEYYSFWKPDPIPAKNEKIAASNLNSLGTLKEVTEELETITNIKYLPKSPWEILDENVHIRYSWRGVILDVKPESDCQVITIRADNPLPKVEFYRLYVQLFEHFEVVILVGTDFLIPKEFKDQF
jgi:hypothetical protein